MDFMGFMPLAKNVYVSQRTSMMRTDGAMTEGYVMKVELPDGETLFGLTRDQVEKLVTLLARTLDT